MLNFGGKMDVMPWSIQMVGDSRPHSMLSSEVSGLLSAQLESHQQRS